MPQNNSTNTTNKQTNAQTLVNIFRKANIVRDDAKQVYIAAIIPSKINKVTPLVSGFTQGWLLDEFFKARGTFPSQSDTTSSIGHADFLAQQQPSIGNVFFRFGFAKNNHYIDMCNDADEVIEITDSNWNILQKSPVYFREFETQRALPTPSKNGDALGIFNYLNIEQEEDRILLLPTLCTFPLANITKPIIGLLGDQDSGKTTAARMIRRLLDPSDPAENDFHPTKQNLCLVFYHNAVPLFDNLSVISQTASDMFCRAYSGTGFQSRKLYTDYALISFSYKRSFIFTAINPPTEAKDFNARTITIQLSQIDGSCQIGDEKLFEQFDQDMPNILGGMLDVLVEAKRIAPGLNLPWKPRWADAFQYAAAAAEVLGYGASRYLEACRANLAERLTQEPSKPAAYSKQEPTLEAILSLMSALQGKFEGTTSNLLAAIAPHCPSNLGPAAAKNWPDSPEKLGIALKRIKAALEEADVAMTSKPSKMGTWITLEWLTTAAPTAQEAVVADTEPSESDVSDTVTFAADELGGEAFEDVDLEAIGFIPEMDPADLPEVVDLDVSELVAPVVDELPLADATADTDSVQEAPDAKAAENVTAIESTVAPAAPITTTPVIPEASSTEELELQAVEEVDEDVCKFWFMGDNEVPCCSAKNSKSLWTSSECVSCDDFVPKYPRRKNIAKQDDKPEEFGMYQSAFK